MEALGHYYTFKFLADPKRDFVVKLTIRAPSQQDAYEQVACLLSNSSFPTWQEYMLPGIEQTAN